MTELVLKVSRPRKLGMSFGYRGAEFVVMGFF